MIQAEIEEKMAGRRIPRVFENRLLGVLNYSFFVRNRMTETEFKKLDKSQFDTDIPVVALLIPSRRTQEIKYFKLLLSNK